MRAVIAALIAIWLAAGCTEGCGSKIADGAANGAEIFDQACSRCHGKHGVPEAGMVAQIGVKDLTTDRVQDSFTDDQLRKQIIDGSENQKMPSFAGALTDDQIEAVIAHVRSLR